MPMIRTRDDVARFRLLPTVTVGSPILLEGQEPGPTSANDAVLQSCSMREGQEQLRMQYTERYCMQYLFVSERRVLNHRNQFSCCSGIGLECLPFFGTVVLS
jgi:hypothetical protein